MTAEPRKLRVLMTADAVGGVWQYCVDLLMSFAGDEVEVVLATLGPRPSLEQKSQLEGMSHLTLVESEYPLEWMPGASETYNSSSRWLLDLQRHFKADLIHLNSYSYASLPWGCPALVVAHSCVFSWWKAVHGSAPPLTNPDWGWYKAAVAAGLSAAASIIAPSFDMAESLSREYGISGGKTRVIYNSCRVPVLRSDRKNPACMAAGRIWDSAKNLSMLDQIATRVQWPIRVAGGKAGPLHSSPPLPNVTLLGVMTHDELIASLETAAIFLHPAVYEPFGLAVLEAARSGCCLVLADIPSLRELWQGHAQFVDARDPDQWVYELNKLIGDKGRRQRLAKSAQVHSLRYSAYQTSAEYLRTYGMLLWQNGDRLSDGAAA